MEEQNDQYSILILKVISLLSIYSLCFIFGMLPYTIESCRKNTVFLSYANIFSGGLFFGIGVFHILPEAVVILGKYYPNIPLSYFLLFGTYSLILFIQKVLFGYVNENMNLENTNIINLEQINNQVDDIRKFGLLNPEEKLSISENSQEIVTNLNNKKENEEEKKIPKDISRESITKEEKEKETKKLTSYILLLALSIHGLFECLALGIQKRYHDIFILYIALMIHKWAEAFTLGIFFVRGELTGKHHLWLIIFFSLIGPLGIIIGIILSNLSSEFVEGIFLAISSGTFVYVSCSEVIIEEFSNPENRYQKFLIFLIGGLAAGGLTAFEIIFE